MVNGQWSMVNGQWSLGNSPIVHYSLSIQQAAPCGKLKLHRFGTALTAAIPVELYITHDSARSYNYSLAKVN